MKLPLLGGTSRSTTTDANEQIEAALIEAIRESDDKTIEIRPANRSKGGRVLRVLVVVAAALGLSYWLHKSQKPTELIRGASETADRSGAETIKEGSDAVAEDIEEGSRKAGEEIEQTGDEVADATEEIGETAAETMDEDSSSFGD